MHIFDKPNLSGDWKCPICGTSTETPVTLIPILGTEDGGNIKAEPVHVDCIDLTFYPAEPEIGKNALLAQKIPLPEQIYTED